MMKNRMTDTTTKEKTLNSYTYKNQEKLINYQECDNIVTYEH